LAALLAAGLDSDVLQRSVGRLPLGGYQLAMYQQSSGGLAAMRCEVTLTQSQPTRTMADIIGLLAKAELPRSLIERAVRVFHRLAVAEGKALGIPPAQVQLGERRAVEAIVAVVGAVVGLAELGIQEVVCSPLPLGSGFVQTERGKIPVPVPAVVELVRNVPVYDNGEEGQLLTPTGAAILTTLAAGYGGLPKIRLLETGYGSGRSEGRNLPNVVRLLIGEAEGAGGAAAPPDEIVGLLETHLDDQDPPIPEQVVDQLFAAGALDVFLTPIVMSRGRTGFKLTIVVPPNRQQECQQVVFSGTTATGLRSYTARRCVFEREIVAVETDFGPMRVKVA
ncbi:MAG: DUF111 family protein, partial [Cyanobacteria bacterium REEB65]|nr:DUF111 family protein [Cyanobacteria bacterium REEB65]